MPLNAIIVRAISEGVKRNIRAIEGYDQQLRAEMGVPSTFDIEAIGEEEIERMLRMQHKVDEEQPCVVCLLESLNPIAQVPEQAQGLRLVS